MPALDVPTATAVLSVPACDDYRGSIVRRDAGLVEDGVERLRRPRSGRLLT